MSNITVFRNDEKDCAWLRDSFLVQPRVAKYETESKGGPSFAI